MIHVYGDYYILPEATQYRVVTPSGVDKKTKALLWDTVSYNTTMEQALRSIRNRMFKDQVRDYEVELSEAIETWARITTELDEIIKSAVGELK